MNHATCRVGKWCWLQRFLARGTNFRYDNDPVVQSPETRFEVRVALEPAAHRFPYPADPEHGVHPYRSLVKSPQDIDLIPELRNEPALKSFIAAVNSESGTFETLRVANWDEGMAAGYRKVVVIGFMFRDRRIASGYENCFMLLGNLMQALASGVVRPDEPILLEIQPAAMRIEGINAWAMDIYLGFRGRDKEETETRMAEGLTRATPFFLTGRI